MRRLILESFYRVAASGVVPRRLFVGPIPTPPPPNDRAPRIEIVSHCWRYGRFLSYQLSSLALFPPRSASVTMTVFYSPQDAGTVRVLERFGAMEVRGVEWNWQPLEPERLFRRAIGRDLAARATSADWVWFSDCDVLFRESALDAAAATLRDRQDVLLFPRAHRVSDLLDDGDPMLDAAADRSRLPDIDPSHFHTETREKAVGGFQILRGDVARARGYCGDIPFYREPVPRWQKTYEDRTLRWLLGTHGTAVDIPGLYRIRHARKGRDAHAPEPGLRRLTGRLRTFLRDMKERSQGQR